MAPIASSAALGVNQRRVINPYAIGDRVETNPSAYFSV